MDPLCCVCCLLLVEQEMRGTLFSDPGALFLCWSHIRPSVHSCKAEIASEVGHCYLTLIGILSLKYILVIR